LREHEHIQVFADANPTYFPQFELGEAYNKNVGGKAAHYGKHQPVKTEQGARRYPTSVWRFSLDNARHGVHPTQKPFALMERLVLTYSEAGAIILDPFAGSGTTGAAARNTGRQYILGDMTAEYVDVARKRLEQPYTMPMFGGVVLAASAGG
jgi:DNA modification methylase